MRDGWPMRADCFEGRQWRHLCGLSSSDIMLPISARHSAYLTPSFAARCGLNSVDGLARFRAVDVGGGLLLGKWWAIGSKIAPQLQMAVAQSCTDSRLAMCLSSVSN